MKVLITGASGLIGNVLKSHLEQLGHECWGLSRNASGIREISWRPGGGEIDLEALRGFDAVIHLAGESLAERWTKEKKEEILESRESGTQLIAGALASINPKPKVLISASATGYYPFDGQIYDETGPSGKSFLSEVCRRWEAAADAARTAGIRVVHPRIGVVLSPDGGALAKMIPVFRTGMGGYAGSGKQRVSWIHPVDLVRAMQLLLDNESIDGPINVVSPNPVSNKEFAQALGRALHKPAKMKAPGMAIRAMYGEMGVETVLSDNPVRPAKLQALGFEWKFPEIEQAMQDVLS